VYAELDTEASGILTKIFGLSFVSFVSLVVKGLSELRHRPPLIVMPSQPI